MTSVSSRPVARLSTPGDVVATVPTLCGFLPQDSVVVLSLRGRRRRLGLTVRLDLPPAAARHDAAQLLAERVAQDGAATAVVVVFADALCPELVSELTAQLRRRAVPVVEALHVRSGRWTSYLCVGPCCPAEGTPVPPVPGLIAAEQALDGRAVLASREDLVRALEPDPTATRAYAGARRQWARLWAGDPDEARSTVLRRAGQALDVLADGGAPGAEVCAALGAALHDVGVRDELATWWLEQPDALLSLAESVARATPPPFDAPACTLLAWLAYARGDGARANVALDRALHGDPQYSLALLLRHALDAAVPPAEVQEVLRQTREALRAD